MSDVNQRSMNHIRLTKWLVLSLFIGLGQLQVMGQQMTIATQDTCICTENPLRALDTIIFSSPSSDSVFLEDYSPRISPNQVLYYEAFGSEFYLSWQTPQRDTLELLNPGGPAPFLFRYIGYRVSSSSFDTLLFRQTGLNDVIVSLGACVPPNGSIVGRDSICLSDAEQYVVNIPSGQLASSTWTISGMTLAGETVPETPVMAPMTGSGTIPLMSGSGISTQLTGSGFAMGMGPDSTNNGNSLNVAFGQPGNYILQISATTTKMCFFEEAIDVYVQNDDYQIEGFNELCARDTVMYTLPVDAAYDSIMWSVGDAALAQIIGDSMSRDVMIAVQDTTGMVDLIAFAQCGTSAMCTVMDTLTLTIADDLNAVIASTDSSRLGIPADTLVCLGDVREFGINVFNTDSVTWTSLTDKTSFPMGAVMMDTVQVRFDSVGVDTIVVMGTTQMGCTFSDSLIVRIQGTEVMILGEVDVCAGDTAGYVAMYADGTPAEFMDITWTLFADSTVVDTMTAMSTDGVPGDSLIAIWTGRGNYDIAVTGMTVAGCLLQDTFTVNVIDTSFTILGPQIACVGAPATFNLVQSVDSMDVLMFPDSVTWSVSIGSPSKPDSKFTPEILTDFDFNDTLVHNFQTSTFDRTFDYFVVASGMANGCAFSDTIQVTVVGDADDDELAVLGPHDLQFCAGVDSVQFRLGVPDSILVGPVDWSVVQKSTGAPLTPASIFNNNGDSVQVTFPNDTGIFVVRAQGQLGGQCPFDVSTEVDLSDDIVIVNAMNLDTTCLTPDSQVYFLNIDTTQLSIADLDVTITRVDDGTVFAPMKTGSGGRLGAFVTWDRAGEYQLRFRGSLDSMGCDIDERLDILVKDTLYEIVGDFQICAGDTTTYFVPQGWNDMPIADFPMDDSINWVFNPAVVDTSFVVGEIGDTITIVWSGNGKYSLAVMDSTTCCPIEVMDSVLVRVPGTFDLSGPDTVCVDSLGGFIITNMDGSFIDDLIPDSTEWTVSRGSIVSTDPDSITVRFDLGDDFVNTQDTIVFRGMTDDGCEVLDTAIVTIRNTDAVILGPTAVCQGDSVMMRLVNAFDSTLTGLTSVQWIITPGDTLMSNDTLTSFIDSSGMAQVAWTEEGSYTVSALGFILDSCVVAASTMVDVSALPPAGIEGDLNTCVNSFDTYMLDIAMSDLDSIRWMVSPFAGSPSTGATIRSGQGTTEVEIEWSAVGEYFITVTGATTGGCEFSYQLDIKIIDAANIGQLVCNNDINVTLAESCELMLTPDMILEQPDPTIPDEQYEITVRDRVSGVELSKGVVDISLLGVDLEVEILHECSGQSCWGNITLEDKNIPELICGADTLECDESIDPTRLDFGDLRRFGFPIPADITNVTRVTGSQNSYTVVGYEKCGDATLSFVDRIEDEICTGDFGTIILRDWTMTNVSGLSSTCTDTLRIRRIDIDSIDLSVLPTRLTFDCSVDENRLEPGSLTGDLDLAMTPFCFNIQVQHTDTRADGCSQNNFSITREWTIFDWCSGDVVIHNQYIKVVDTTGPRITLATGDINIEATDHECSGLYDLTPDITLSDNCSGIESATVRIFEFDEHVPPGRLIMTITDQDFDSLAFDESITKILIEVSATDSCGITTEGSVMRDINTEDNIMPVPICDENTTVAIGSNGWSLADFKAFDDGSIDNCGVDKICITRMDHLDIFDRLDTDNDNLVVFDTFQLNIDGAENEFGPLSTIYEDATEMIGSTEFIRLDSLCRPYIKFNCLDAMDTLPLQVQLTVFDKAGNSNSCMVNTIVQDNSPINKIVTAGDSTISCTDDVTSFLMDRDRPFTFLTTTCGIPLPPDSYTAIIDTNQCGVGTIRRIWSVTDDFNNTISHEQLITIGRDDEKFDPAVLPSVWPDDFEGEGCAGPGTDPDNLDARFRPDLDLNQFPCSDLALDFEDLVFYNTEGFCAKILRTWTLYDWCNRNSRNEPATYTHVQLLKVNDTEAPTILTGCQMETFTVTNQSNCTAFVSTSATAEDCHAPEDLIWSYVIKDSNNANTQVGAGSTSMITSNLEIGSYDITWIVADRCGNQDSCVKSITVVDGVAPVIECRNRTLTLMANGSLTVTPSEFVAVAGDNCTMEDDLTYTFQSSTGAMMQEFTCQNLDRQEFRDFSLQIFVTDEAGNSSSCSVTLTLQEGANSCGGNVGMAAIDGVVYTEEDFTIDNAEISVTQMGTGGVSTMMTPLEGEYAFSTLPMFDSYEVTVVRDDAYLNGVSTLDLVMIQQHILGLRDLDSPYKIIAADVDASSQVSAGDLVHLRRLILGRAVDLPIGQSWTFVDASQTWENELRPFPYSQEVVIEDLESDISDVDLIGVKMGDVNGNVQLQSSILGITRSTAQIEINLIEEVGEEKIIGLTPVSTTEIIGAQMALTYDPRHTEIIGVLSEQVEIAPEHYTILDGELRISWNAKEEQFLASDMPLLEVVVRTNQDDLSTILTPSEGSLTPEIYRKQGESFEVSDVSFITVDASLTQEILQVDQNNPNPWQRETAISFYLPQTGDVSLSIYDLTGKELKSLSGNYSQGWNQVILDRDQLPSTGVYMYELSDGLTIVRKKMIIVE